VKRLARAGVTANQVTIAAAALSVGVGITVYFLSSSTWIFFLVPAVLLARMALNAIDGMLAREHGMASPLGAFLNELGDVISDAGLYLPFAVVAGARGEWVVLVVVAAAVSELAGVMGGVVGARRRYDGPMGKSDRALVFGVIALVLGCGVDGGLWLTLCFAVMFSLICVNVVLRIVKALREVR
jgi:CDP-diacylglycerol--glycerol-3-phosphate 3-phosphatidyltransferase